MIYRVNIAGLKFRKTDYQGKKLRINPHDTIAKRLQAQKTIIAVRQGESPENILSYLAQRTCNIVQVFDDSPFDLREMGQAMQIQVIGEQQPRNVIFMGIHASAPHRSALEKRVVATINGYGIQTAMMIFGRCTGYKIGLYGELMGDGMIRFDRNDNRKYFLLSPGANVRHDPKTSIQISGLEECLGRLNEYSLAGQVVNADAVWAYLFEYAPKQG